MAAKYRNAERSLKALHEAYAELLREKPAQRITVTDVARKADLTRNTFYSYFSSIGDLHDSYFSYWKVFIEYLHRRKVVFDSDNISALVSASADYVYEFHDRYHDFVERFATSPNLRYILRRIVVNIYLALLDDMRTAGKKVTERDRRCMSYLCFVAYDLMYQNACNDLVISRDEFAKTLLDLVEPFCLLMRHNEVTPKGSDPAMLLIGVSVDTNTDGDTLKDFGFYDSADSPNTISNVADD
ncbi:MAG: TetR/AcrR family transcriptional regulator [Bifidobacteriaceae bacterium]|nr:TetR/AcrR family transcriptional regulator [Bifidobacteriaceae bacterium]